MADNSVTATPGSGVTFASDQIGGIEYPRVKLTSGADGTATDVSSGAPLPVVQTGTPALPTGAATEATLAAASAKLPAALGQAAMAASMAVVIASNQSAVPVSAASLPLPTGAATLAKQPALGTAGTASADVISVQGIASMTALKVDGSAVTQPVSGSLTNISGTISLPTGAATAANQATEISSLASIDAKLTNPLPVSGTVAATQSGTWNITNVSGTVSLPTGAALEAGNLATILASIQGGVIVIAGVSYTVKRAFANVAASSTDSNIVSAVAAKVLWIISYRIIAGTTATNVTFNTKPAGAGTAIDFLHACAASGGAMGQRNIDSWFRTGSGEGLTVTTGAGSTVGIGVTYIEV